MIVKNEAAIIEERLEAVADLVDGYVIVDTGSADDTVRLIEATMNRGGDSLGVILRHPWAGFADARTMAVRSATDWAEQQGGEWWALLLDADTVFHAMSNWRNALSSRVDAVACEVHHGSIRYKHPRLLRLSAHNEWRWRGVLHEYLVVPAGRTMVDTHLVWVEHGSGGARSKDPDKYRKDAELLTVERARLLSEAPANYEAQRDLDLLPRYAFYEAQSWRDAGCAAAAEGAYRRRVEMGGFGQEVYLSWLNIGELRLADGDLVGALEAWTRAWAVDPSRAEALVGLATICRTWKAWWPAWTYGQEAVLAAENGSAGMFADQNVGWRAYFEVSVAAWYVGKLARGKYCCEQVLASELAPESVKERTRANLALYESVLTVAS